jgi:hypothetical protein
LPGGTQLGWAEAALDISVIAATALIMMDLAVMSISPCKIRLGSDTPMLRPSALNLI